MPPERLARRCHIHLEALRQARDHVLAAGEHAEAMQDGSWNWYIYWVAACGAGHLRDPRAFWRIQNKVLDKQNKAAGTRDQLADEKKRVRIEVTLGREGCREIGLEQFADLEVLGIARLQKGFFQFMKPTFAIVRPSAARPASTAVKRKVEEYRRDTEEIGS